MKTKFVGMKEFRQNLASYTKKSRSGGIRYIVLKKNVPVLEVKPIDEKEFAKQMFKEKLDKSYEQFKRGEYYTREQIMKEFGLL